MFPPQKIIGNAFWAARREVASQDLKARTNIFLGNRALSSHRKKIAHLRRIHELLVVVAQAGACQISLPGSMSLIATKAESGYSQNCRIVAF